MKRCVILFGGCGGRLAEAMTFAACAGVLMAPDMRVLLVEPDAGEVHMLRAQALLRDYERIRRLFDEDAECDAFSTRIHFSRWPDRMPGGAQTLRGWTGEEEEDELLCQALFTRQAAEQNLRQGFKGNIPLAATTFAGLLMESSRLGEDALAALLRELEGEDAQIVLAGSLCGATGNVGIPALAAYLRRELGERVKLSAVLMAAYGAGEDAAAARDALNACLNMGFHMPVCLLGLPESARLTELTDAARVTEWLAVHAIDWMLRHDASDHSAYTYRAPAGALSWEIFGREAAMFRSGYVRLMKTALVFRAVFKEELEERIAHPNALRDRMAGWYSACCRGVLRMDETQRGQLQEDLAALMGLLEGAWAWVEQMVVTQPAEMRHATAVAAARKAARENYRALVELAAQLEVLNSEAQQSGVIDERVVHRGGDVQEDEGDRIRRQLQAMEEKLQALRDDQTRLNRRMGGSATLSMLYEMQEACRQEADALRAQETEANRRINQAEEIATPQEQYRILAARTKLKRMERHVAMLDARTRCVEKDIAQARSIGLRWQPPEVIGEGERPECGLFVPELLGVMQGLQKAADKKAWRQQQEAAEEVFNRFAVLPGPDGVTVKRLMQQLGRGKAEGEHPLACLLARTMTLALEEEEA